MNTATHIVPTTVRDNDQTRPVRMTYRCNACKQVYTVAGNPLERKANGGLFFEKNELCPNPQCLHPRSTSTNEVLSFGVLSGEAVINDEQQA